ncbi:MAG: prepilin-type N-terminal cleavage/methylation domain-containing protein [Nitrospira sp.]|nr:prepilin-type N-terminal cleavage/methylation domain-containing protein [Nitrospira sp.]
MKLLRSSSGFTLIELLVVMSIMGILLTIAQPSYKQATIKAREAALKSNLSTFRDVIDQYYADQGGYPQSLTDLSEKGYLRQLPTDPFTRSNSTWIEISLQSEEGEAEGIYDVHSGSDLVALDGTAYNEW